MATHEPQTPAYPLPPGREISAAVTEALNAAHKALDRLGRVMAVVTAAAVRDILTDHDHGAPFDAGYAELHEAADGSLLATGRYWTTSGEERHFATTPGVENAETGVYDMNEWVPYLNPSTEDVWMPLVEKRGTRDGRDVYRIDLAKAAALPLD